MIQGPSCGVAKILAVADPELHTEIVAAINDPTIAGAHLSRALAQHGLRVSGPMIMRHRRTDCGCYR